jgi:hypothetical protein
MVEGVTAEDTAAAVAAADRLGYPVVVKVVSPGLAHKSEVGGVALDLRRPEAVAAAFEGVVEAGRVAGLKVQGARVERYRPGIEVIVGGLVDPVFGPLISVGIGGVLTELLGDVVFAPAPVGERGAMAMLDRLQGRPLFDGYRGTPPAEVDQLARIVSVVSRGLVGSELLEVEINPLVWDGREWVAVDWLVAS